MPRDAVRTLDDDDDHRSIGRYLIQDDDRHNDGPNENESTNNPTILGYTRSVSNERKLCMTKRKNFLRNSYAIKWNQPIYIILTFPL